MSRLSTTLQLCAGLLLWLSAAFSQAAGLEQLRNHQWHHGAEDCSRSTDPAFELYHYDSSTYILRQNKCDTFEAPFLYLLLGEGRALLLDSGVQAPVGDKALFELVAPIIGPRQLLVVHSHGHRDHYGGDDQFSDNSQTTVVGTGSAEFRRFFGFNDWPQGQGSIELVGRKLLVVPAPGHQEEAIALYDPQTRWLLTGDTLYPGQVYVKDWDDYRASIRRLAAFSEEHPVSSLMGAHIEMSKEPGKLYPLGTLYQPQEAPLPLPPTLLRKLDESIAAAETPRQIAMDSVLVTPMNPVQKTLSNLARWLTQ